MASGLEKSQLTAWAGKGFMSYGCMEDAEQDGSSLNEKKGGGWLFGRKSSIQHRKLPGGVCGRNEMTY